MKAREKLTRDEFMNVLRKARNGAEIPVRQAGRVWELYEAGATPKTIGQTLYAISGGGGSEGHNFKNAIIRAEQRKAIPTVRVRDTVNALMELGFSDTCAYEMIKTAFWSPDMNEKFKLVAV